MRGAMHTAIERESGPWAAALLTAPAVRRPAFLCQGQHSPRRRSVGRAASTCCSALSRPWAIRPWLFDSLLSWLLVGLILSLTRVLTGNIAVAIGLHAGWVLVLRMLQEATEQRRCTGIFHLGGRFDGLLGYWLLPWGRSSPPRFG